MSNVLLVVGQVFCLKEMDFILRITEVTVIRKRKKLIKSPELPKLKGPNQIVIVHQGLPKLVENRNQKVPQRLIPLLVPKLPNEESI
tara:strand:+ start:60308 stop:60568 length:261 start_codon:yes stop_codon:yes gene_type:complete